MTDAARPLILITNDDGVRSPGLAAVAAAVSDLGDLLIVAPNRQQTTMGRAFPVAAGIGRIEEIALRLHGSAAPAYGVAGSPAQAVAHGVLELADRLPLLCISGINYGENLGSALTCSGTVGAAFEAYSHGIPAIAVSREAPLRLIHSSAYPPLDWGVAARVARLLAVQVLREGLPPDTCILNVNVPDSAVDVSEIRSTRQSRMSSSVFVRPDARRREAPFRLRCGPSRSIGMAEEDSDIRAFALDRVISVTPLSWDMSANAKWRCPWERAQGDKEGAPPDGGPAR